jgi:hypothetical protein
VVRSEADGGGATDTEEYAWLEAASGEPTEEPESEGLCDSVWSARESSAKFRDSASMALHICARLRLQTARHWGILDSAGGQEGIEAIPIGPSAL